MYRTATIIVLCGLVAVGSLIVYLKAWPYIEGKYHSKVTSYRVFFTDLIPTYVYLKLETVDAFIACNPINISIGTGIVDTEKVKGIQLTFDGAGMYFPNFSKPLSYESLEESLKHIVILQNQTMPVSLITHFYGNVQNLTYSSGGDFDVGITITRADGSVVGYEMGDRRYVIRQAIRVSPPEILLELHSNNLMTGLAWIGIGLPFLIAGMTGFAYLLTSACARRYDGSIGGAEP